jgi:predicted alpha/beta hydrolase family esterase
LQKEKALLAAAARYAFVLVPGRFNSGSEHWQSIWERELPIWTRIEQRNWSDPDIDRWIGSIRRTLADCRHPAFLAGHSLGALACCAIAVEMPARIAGLLLVAPAEPSRFDAEAAVPERSLGVPSIVAASRDDPFMSFARAEYWASTWGSELADLGDAGHINAESGFGPWWFGLELLARLLERADAARSSGE